MKRTTGHYDRTSTLGEEVAAFIPDPLPPANPPIVLDDLLRDRLRSAEHALARLEVAGEMVPSLNWFIYAFVRKEAVLSSQIEGTQATLVDLLEYEAHGAAGEAQVQSPDVGEVCNYLDALEFARTQIADPAGLPLSMRLLNQTHQRLMSGVRGAEKLPGEVRRSQNWIGGSRPGNAAYVPPPPHALGEVLGAFERYIHAEDGLSPLVRAGLLHVQFETVHPYLDGNGRIGRLLVMLLLEHWKLLRAPLLYLSLYFKRHRQEYYQRLNAVRVEGDWEGWLTFFLTGVEEIANEAVASARSLFSLVDRDRARLMELEGMSFPSMRLFEKLPGGPITSVAAAASLLKVPRSTADRAVAQLAQAGVLVETTGKKRDRMYSYRAYLDLLRTGTELKEGEGR